MHLISIRINEIQLQKIDNLASQLATSRAQIIRYLIEGHFDKMRPLKLTHKELNSLLKLWKKTIEKLGKLSTNCSQLCSLNRKLGSNVNQIAKTSNIPHRYISPTTKAAAGKIISTLCCQNDTLNNSLTKLWKRLEMTKIGLH